MKRNLEDPLLTHSTADLCRQNQRLETLSNAIYDSALRMVERGVAAHMAHTVSAVDLDEADTLLRSMLTELDETQLPAHDDLIRQVDIRFVPADDTVDRAWIGRMARDFALAAAAFWLNDRDLRQSDDSGHARTHALDSGHSFSEFELLASRFYVESPVELWTELQRHAPQKQVALAEPDFVPAHQYSQHEDHVHA